MLPKNHYNEHNYHLKDIHEIAKLLHDRKLSEDILFDALNKISGQFIIEVRDRYKNYVGPVNSLRFELAELMLQKKQISKDLINERILEIERKSGKRSFKSYSSFSILYPFFDAGIDFNIKESLTNLSDSIVNTLDLVGKVKIHSVDFWGSRGFGEDRAWTAIYNASHESHQTAKQLFISINHDGVFCGVYDRANLQFIDEATIEANESTVRNISDFFDKHVTEISNDEYSKASYLSIGIRGAKFYKLSHGTEFFTKEDIQACIDENIVSVHKDTKPKARTPIAQFKIYEKASAGDFFYCCWGNNQLLFIGQFIDNDVRDYSLTVDPDRWMERSYRIIQEVQYVDSYRGPKKWWTPNDPSTFIEVPESDYEDLNKHILQPYFHAELDTEKITLLPQEKVGIASQKRIKVLDHQVTPKLDIKIVTKEFANIIENLDDNKGQMLGIFGSWGRGKTFFVEQLKKEFKTELESDEKYINLTFNAWKYQETETIWAYLYDVVLKSYLSDKVDKTLSINKKKYIEWKRTFCLNIKRKGKSRLIAIILGFLATLIITYGISSEFKQEIAGWAIGAVSIIGIIQGYKIYKKYYQGFKDLIVDYSTQHNYKVILGLQAEIQEELIVLLKHWLGRTDKRRVLLFVDDLDRCNEDKIIRIIDALRVMLDDDYLVSKLIIVVAVDELLLERAIQLKYTDFHIDLSDKNIVQEYMDKLFIAGIKFPGLYEDEQAVILETYALDGNILEQLVPGENLNDKGEIVVPPTPVEVDSFMYPEPDLVSSKIVESDFFLLRSELEILQNYSKHISRNITPRALRIYMYRYLLSKNLVSNYMSVNSRYQLDNELCEFLAKAIAYKSSNSNFNSIEIDEYKKMKAGKLKDFLPKLIEMTVPY
jgi:hypothetical protein